MKAITVRQPWAWAIIHGGKDVENRSRHTNYRGQLYIHAGLGYSKEAEEFRPMQDAWKGAAQLLAVERGNMGPLRKADLFLDYGAVLGTVELVDSHSWQRCRTLHGDRLCSPWAVNYGYHWELANPRPLTCPFPEKGKLGIWNLLPQAVTA